MSRFSDIQKQQQQRSASHTTVMRAPSPEEAAYVAGDSTPFTENFGGQMIRGVRGLGNMLFRMGNYQPDTPELIKQRENLPFFGDKAIREQEEMDKPLQAQPGAGVGGFLGGMMVTPALPGGAAAKTGGWLTKTLGARAAPRAVEGGVGAAQWADPNNTGAAGATGTVLSLALGRLGDAGGKLARGAVKKSSAAQHLEHLAAQHGENMHIPLSLSADMADPLSAMAAGAYRGVTPLIPFASGRLERQREAARKQLRDIIYREASPTGLNLSPDDLSNADKALGKISDEFKKQYGDTVKSYAFNVPSDLESQLTASIRKARNNIDSTTLEETTKKMMAVLGRFSENSGVIQGDNLLFARKAIGDMLPDAPIYEQDAYRAALEWIDNHIVNELNQGKKATNVADLRKYLELAEPWKAKVATEKAAERAFLGQFGPEDLYRTSRPGTITREIGRAGAEVLEPNATRQSLEGKILGGALLGGVGHYMGLLPAVALTAGGNLATTKTMQRALTGDLAIQQWLNSRLPATKTQAITSALRRGAVAETGDAYDGY